ncbi:MAG: hypothetical protein IPM47_17400 [Sphingobacteriales bacterium]|nr:MAG: hypothetical protein IPM47_17400 [Sphingobacteriales bacterium]
MKTGIITAAVLFVLFITNPSMQKHKDSINRKCKEINPIAGAIGGCALYSKFSCEYHNCVLFSYILDSDNNILISFGVLGIPIICKDLDI